MSNYLRDIVELTHIEDGVMKAVLLHIADTVRDADSSFFRSKYNVAKRIGFHVKTVRRKLSDLVDARVLLDGGAKRTPAGMIDIYLINLPVILALPCIEGNDSRQDIAAKLNSVAVGPRIPDAGTRSPGVGKESPPIHEEPCEPELLRKGKNLRLVDSARTPDDHLAKDSDFAAWVQEKRSGYA